MILCRKFCIRNVRSPQMLHSTYVHQDGTTTVWLLLDVSLPVYKLLLSVFRIIHQVSPR